MKFPSEEWAAEFKNAINANEAYRAAAQAWEGDILFLVRVPDPNAAAPGIHLALSHGQCSAATYHADARQVSSEFIYEGTTENWAKLLKGEVDPVKAILDGTFKIRGNLAKAMRFTKAAKELVETASKVPTTA
ncbi:MAG TPA: SCP2 sterol-binding domain-containing protein [Thermoplasmata archaeon]|nr:SCP2 sterol-binding domain-containing protein [Thermoplasmata archaeon]